MIATGSGAFWIIFETAAPTIADKIFWSKLEYSGGAATPVLFLIFVLRYIGRDKLLSTRNILLLFLIPAFTWVLALTNARHNLVWSGYSTISEKTNLMEYYHGIWFWIGYIAYSYILLFISAVLLLRFILHQSRTFRSQAWIVLTGGLFPWIVSVIYLFGGSPVPGLDLTPFSITLSGTLAAYAILNFRFLDLGLAISKAYVEMLGGKIWFESEYKKGTVFFFNIPYHPETESTTFIVDEVQADSEDHKIKRLVVLIVEDDKASEMLLTRLVGPYSIKILKVTTGNKAVEACRNNPGIDLVLMDVKLPEMDGYESTRQIRQFNKDLILLYAIGAGIFLCHFEISHNYSTREYLYRENDQFL